tara:strand:+ start:6355 stop:6675 length:321 start_codon:yes stop_codon:yes gene_type:complete
MSYQMTNLNTDQFITADVVFSFQKAIADKDNLDQGFGSTSFWNFVSADMHMDLSKQYDDTYIDESFDFMADCEMNEISLKEFALQAAGQICGCGCNMPTRQSVESV